MLRSAAMKPTRRELVKALLASFAASHPIHAHLADAAVWSAADAKAASLDWVPECLDARSNETLVALAEVMVHGATRAHVNRFLDLLLSVDTKENQQNVVASLAAMDGEARHRFGPPFAGLTEAQQAAVLTAPRPELLDHFENLKGWIVGAYYSSEIGMTELGFTGAAFFERFPGCPHPDGHR
jgi:hypothetical protein